MLCHFNVVSRVLNVNKKYSYCRYTILFNTIEFIWGCFSRITWIVTLFVSWQYLIMICLIPKYNVLPNSQIHTWTRKLTWEIGYLLFLITTSYQGHQAFPWYNCLFTSETCTFIFIMSSYLPLTPLWRAYSLRSMS